MFATYLALAQEARDVVKAHKDRLVDQIAHILSDGVKQGAFHVADVLRLLNENPNESRNPVPWAVTRAVGKHC